MMFALQSEPVACQVKYHGKCQGCEESAPRRLSSLQQLGWHLSPLINQQLSGEGVPFLLFLQVRLEPLQNPSQAGPVLCFGPGELLAARGCNPSHLLPCSHSAAHGRVGCSFSLSSALCPSCSPCWCVVGIIPRLSRLRAEAQSAFCQGVKPVPSSFFTLCPAGHQQLAPGAGR